MSMFGGQQRFGRHSDVMGAEPADAKGKASLVEEIKNRARGEFGSKNYPSAEMLYAKAVEIAPDDATLHSNLAAVRLGLNKNGEALKNAEEAVRLNPAYGKGHFRMGQALLALERPSEALVAFESGSALEPQSKSWGPQIEKAQKAMKNGPSKGSSPTGSQTSTPSASTRSSSSPAVPTAKKSSATESVRADEGSKEGYGEGGSESMKGYKKTADGRTTTYFHNELSEEARQLIGNIAPKRVDPTEVGSAKEGVEQGAEAAGSSTNGNGVSAWNKAGTWESKDMTGWAKQRLKELLQGLEFDAPRGEGSVEVTEVKELEGDAEVTFSRGKKRSIFYFRFHLAWEADLEGGQAKGKLVYPDVGQDCEGEYDVECQVDSNTPPAAKGFIDRYIRAEGSGLREAVLDRLGTFVEEFNAK